VARRAWIAVATAVALAGLVGAAAWQPVAGHRLKGARKCPVFPHSSHWNRRVDRLPAAGDSARLIGSIGLDRPLHADFGSGRWRGAPIGIPFVIVPGHQRRVPVSFSYRDESDRGRYPIPPHAPIEGGRRSSGDRHVIVVDRYRCRLYELYAAYPVHGGRSWRAGSGAVWSLRSNRLRPRGWTSADAAGLPILPGLARFEELRAGGIDHALRFTAPRTRREFVYPARHFASDSDDPALPPMGLRVRLRASFDVSPFSPQARAVLVALKRYGAILADNGAPWFVGGAPSPNWDNDDLRSLGTVRGRDFQVVDTSRLPRPSQ
jgi:hypothetical protein